MDADSSYACVREGRVHLLCVAYVLVCSPCVCVVAFQVEHHLFPRIPRHNLRAIRAPIQALCAKHGIRFNIVGLVQANVMLIQGFRQAARASKDVDLAQVGCLGCLLL